MYSSILMAFEYYKGGQFSAVHGNGKWKVHRDALPVDKTLSVRAPRLLRVTVGTASNRVMISSALTTDPVGIPIDDMEEFTR